MRVDGVLLDVLHKAQRALEGLVPGHPPRVRLVYDAQGPPILSLECRGSHGGWQTAFVADTISELLENLDRHLMEKTWAAIGRDLPQKCIACRQRVSRRGCAEFRRLWGERKCIDCRKRPATDTSLCDECIEHRRQSGMMAEEAGRDKGGES